MWDGEEEKCEAERSRVPRVKEGELGFLGRAEGAGDLEAVDWGKARI